MNTAPTPTPDQVRAILAADQHCLITAGAGTGKTYTVVGRLLYLLGLDQAGERRAEPLALSDIAAITFTIAAAQDLKRQLRQRLREAGRRDLAHEVDAARIGTIHAFCADLLREFALRAGTHPDPRVLDEGEAAALAAEAVQDTLLEALEQAAVPGLEQLFAQYDLAQVEGWMLPLVQDSDRCRRLLATAGVYPPGDPAATLLTLAGLALDRLDQRLRQDEAVDFDRMVVGTRDLLRDNPGVRSTLQRRLHTLIVDEFQDVDPVQREIAYLLGDPLSDNPATTRLMLVGDPKQSIYRFRRADVTVWRQVERDFTAGHGRPLTLQDNFRSRAPILSLVETVIGAELDSPIAGVELQDFEVPFLSVCPTKPAGPDPAIEIHVAPTEEPAPNAEEIRRRDAARVARRALELHQAGVPWSGMAVLFAAWNTAPIYQSALAALDIPAYTLRTQGFYQRREVLDLIIALEAIRDPEDDTAFLGWLRGPCVGLRDETLLDIARQAAPPYWPKRHRVRVAEAERLAAGVALLAKWSAMRDRVPLHSLLEMVLEEGGYLAHLALAGPAASQAIANVRKLVAIARRHGDKSVGDFLRLVDQLRRAGDAEGDAVLHGADDEVVTLSTIHGAKGLEWDTVFWVDLIRRPQSRDKDGMLVGGPGVVLPPGKVGDVDEAHQAAWDEAKARELAEVTAEQKRLWYVAATRAKERLILGAVVAAKQSPAEMFLARLPALAAVGVAVAGGSGDSQRFRVVPLAAEDRLVPAPPADPSQALLPEESAALTAAADGRRHSATELLARQRCPRRHWLAYRVGLREPEVDRSGAAFISAVARGQIVHDVLERLRAESELDDLLEVAIGRWDPDAPAPGDPGASRYREHLRREIRQVADHPEWRAVAEREGARHELKFVQLRPSGVVTGAVDLAAPEGDGVVLVDVKTFQGDAEAARRKAEQYRPQQDAYVAAMTTIGGRPVSRFAFQFSRAGVQVSQTLDTAAVQAAQDALATGLAELSSEDPPSLTQFPHECRYCGYRQYGLCPGVAPPEPEA